MKKHLIYTVVLVMIFILSFVSINAQNSYALIGKLIVIDPGHGGVDPGTIYGDIYEKNINLEISLLLKTELEKHGAGILLTRDDDYDLSRPNAAYRKKSDFDNRIKFINEHKPDIYISIHLNYLLDSSYYGPQVFYKKEDYKLAKTIQKTLNEFTKTDRNIKLIPSDTYMYDKLNIPGLLVECGFLSNSGERKKLKSPSYQQEFVEVLTKGIILYFT